MKTRLLRIVAFALLCGSPLALADVDEVIDKRVAAETPEQFAKVADQVRDDMRPGGRYEFIRPADKAKAETDLDTMTAMLRKTGAVAAMSDNEKVQLFNTQEHLNGILTHSDSNRLVCDRRTGRDEYPLTTCRTLGEVERERDRSNKVLRDTNSKGAQTICGRSTCGRLGG